MSRHTHTLTHTHTHTTHTQPLPDKYTLPPFQSTHMVSLHTIPSCSGSRVLARHLANVGVCSRARAAWRWECGCMGATPVSTEQHADESVGAWTQHQSPQSSMQMRVWVYGHNTSLHTGPATWVWGYMTMYKKPCQTWCLSQSQRVGLVSLERGVWVGTPPVST